MKNLAKKPKQGFISKEDGHVDEFSLELCQALVSSNIPLNKVNNPNLRNFLEKYCNRPIPTRTTLSKNYVGECYNKTMAEIKEEFVGKFFWASVDETTDRCGRCVANLIVGVLDPAQWKRPHLIAVKPLIDGEGNPKVDGDTVARFVNSSLDNLIGQNKEKLLLLVTDAARYMKRAADGLKIFMRICF